MRNKVTEVSQMHRPLRWFLDALQPGVLFVRLLCRGGNTPHGQISDRVAAHSPWQGRHQFRDAWAGLLVEGVLIHLIMAITAVPLLLIISCHHGNRVAPALAAVFITRAIAEVPLSKPSHVLCRCHLSVANLMAMVGLALVSSKFHDMCRAWIAGSNSAPCLLRMKKSHPLFSNQ